MRKYGEYSLLLTILFLTIDNVSVANDYQNNHSNGTILYTMVIVCDDYLANADAHLLIFDNKLTYAIDAGGNKKFADYLIKNNIKRINKLFISHWHKDHYGGLFELIKAGIIIDELYFNKLPKKDLCDREKPWGCDYEDILNTIRFLDNNKVKFHTLKSGDVFTPMQDATVSVLFACGSITGSVKCPDINDTSVILKLSFGTISILFSGDVNKTIGNFLVKNNYNLKASILKVPHHGTEGVVENIFFDAVEPQLALVPAAKVLWLSNRSKRIREYFKEKKIPVLVSGINGDVTITINKHIFSTNYHAAGSEVFR